MNRLVSGFLSNDSFFGRLMTKIAIIVGANLTFLVFSIPVVTIGPALAALYYVMLETLYTNSALNPFKTFWKGFKTNFKQAILTWLIFLVIAVLAYFDIRFSRWAGGIFSAFLIAIYVVLVAAVILYSYLYPVMASFNGTIRELFTNSIYFAFKKPLRMILLVGVEAGAFFLTYFYLDMLPLWAFCWFFFGFGAIAMLGAKLLLPLFKPYQQKAETEPAVETAQKTSAAKANKKADGKDSKEITAKDSQDTSVKDSLQASGKDNKEASGKDSIAVAGKDNKEASAKGSKKTSSKENREVFAEYGYSAQEMKLSDDDLDSMDDLQKLDGV